MRVLTTYIDEAVKTAQYKRLDDGNWFASITGFEGVWGCGETIETCRQELIEVLEEWLILKIRDNDEIPVINGIDLRVKEKVAI